MVVETVEKSVNDLFGLLFFCAELCGKRILVFNLSTGLDEFHNFSTFIHRVFHRLFITLLLL